MWEKLKIFKNKKFCKAHRRPSSGARSSLQSARHKGSNSISYTVCLPEDVVNIYYRGRTQGSPNVVKEHVGLKLLRIIMYPVNDGDRIFLDKYPFYMQLLLGTGDAYSGGYKLSFWDRRLEEKIAPSSQPPTIWILDNRPSDTLGFSSPT